MSPMNPRLMLGMESSLPESTRRAVCSLNAPLEPKFDSGPAGGPALHYLRPETICATRLPSSSSQ
jgi:hypothetical protein